MVYLKLLIETIINVSERPAPPAPIPEPNNDNNKTHNDNDSISNNTHIANNASPRY